MEYKWVHSYPLPLSLMTNFAALPCCSTSSFEVSEMSTGSKSGAEEHKSQGIVGNSSCMTG